MMNDYIKREKVLSDIDELKKSPWYTQEIGRLFREEAVDIVVKLCINAQRPSDAVEVVRCKDCAKSYKDRIYVVGRGPEIGLCCGAGPCEDAVVYEDFFCARGTPRKEKET